MTLLGDTSWADWAAKPKLVTVRIAERKFIQTIVLAFHWPRTTTFGAQISVKCVSIID